jgi:hypothetical protein
MDDILHSSLLTPLLKYEVFVGRLAAIIGRNLTRLFDELLDEIVVGKILVRALLVTTHALWRSVGDSGEDGAEWLVSSEAGGVEG